MTIADSASVGTSIRHSNTAQLQGGLVENACSLNKFIFVDGNKGRVNQSPSIETPAY